MAEALAQEGATVAISSRSRERIEQAAARTGARGYVHDTADVDGVPTLVRSVRDELGPIDILQEFGAAGASLCSEPAAYITGTTVLVDGGQPEACNAAGRRQAQAEPATGS